MKRNISRSIAVLLMTCILSTGVYAAQGPDTCEEVSSEGSVVAVETGSVCDQDIEETAGSEVTTDSESISEADRDSASDNTADSTEKTGDQKKDTASENAAKVRNYVTSLNGVPIIVAKQKIDISSEFGAAGMIKKYIVEPKGYGKVTRKGILTGKKPGKITINAVDSSGSVIGSIERVVYQPRLSPMTVTKRGEVIYAEDYLKGDSDYLVKPTRWSISKSLASIDPETGKITVSQEGKHGKVLVTVFYGEGSGAAKYKAALNVNLPYLNVTKLTMTAGTYKKLKLKNAPTDTPVIWSSSKEKVATVNDNGKIKAKKAGKCEISARVGDFEYICKLTVKSDDDD